MYSQPLAKKLHKDRTIRKKKDKQPVKSNFRTHKKLKRLHKSIKHPEEGVFSIKDLLNV